MPDLAQIQEELQRHSHLTLQLVWEEYRQAHPDAYGYSRFELKALGHSVDLNDRAIVKAMSTNAAQYVCIDIFKKMLLALTIEEQKPQLLEPARMRVCCQLANLFRGP